MSSLNLVRWGGVAAMVGGALFAVLAPQDSSLVPLFIIPGLLALIVGFVLLSVAALRDTARSGLAMLGFNDQNWQALMAVPNGLAWLAVGYVLWSDREGVDCKRRRACSASVSWRRALSPSGRSW